MSEKEYKELASKRDNISKLLKGPTLKVHRLDLEKQLVEIRAKISDAHREKHYGRGTKEYNSFDIAE